MSIDKLESGKCDSLHQLRDEELGVVTGGCIQGIGFSKVGGETLKDYYQIEFGLKFPGGVGCMGVP
jgi:hypothetical protein